jgi:hypothetical protein
MDKQRPRDVPPRERTMPSAAMLKAAGFVRCSKKGCSIWISPVDLGDRCLRHGGGQ